MKHPKPTKGNKNPTGGEKSVFTQQQDYVLLQDKTPVAIAIYLLPSPLVMKPHLQQELHLNLFNIFTLIFSNRPHDISVYQTA